MNSILSAGKTLQLIDRLKSSVEEFAARTEKVNGEHRTNLAKERRRYETAVEEQNSQLAAALGEVDATFQNVRTALLARFEQRKARIGRAYQSSKELALQRIEDKVGGRKYEMQKRMLQAERDRESGLAKTTATFQEFRNGLAAEQENLAELERNAQSAFGGYGKLRRIFLGAYAKAEAPIDTDESRLLAEMGQQMNHAKADLDRLKKSPLFVLFRFFIVWLLLCAAPLAVFIPQAGIRAYTPYQGLALAGLALVVVGVVRFLATAKALPLATAVSKALARARRLHDACAERCETHYQQEMERLKREFAQTTQTSEDHLRQAVGEASGLRVSSRMKTDERTVKLNEKHQRLHREKLERLEHEHHDAVSRLRQATEIRTKALLRTWEERQGKLTSLQSEQIKELQVEWRERLGPLYETLEVSRRAADELFPAWTAPGWSDWQPPKDFAQAGRFAGMQVDVARLCEAMPKDKSLALPGPGQFTAPLCLRYPEQGSILFETSGSGQPEVVNALNNIILRLLATAPAGRLNFTVIDPVGLGQNFAGVMHLADYEEQIINSRIWTQSSQIEQKLADLNEHMEKVIQMYLRNEYQTIAEYNEQAGVIAEKYHFVVIADFPSAFTETAAKRLLSIAASGARCGVYMLMHWDRRQPLPEGFLSDELRKSCFGVTASAAGMTVTGKVVSGATLVLDEPPTAERTTQFIQRVGVLSRDSSRVEVPFEHVAPPDSELWSAETTNELRVSIGRTGATKLQYLEIGKGTRQHGLVAGKTGSGKSTLFHVLITNLSLWCSPEQVEFYLVDFKKGVEFKCYAAKRLPHARVVAIESDREFGLSVLQKVDDELRRRGDMFRQLGVQDVAGYKRAGGKESIPRTLLLIDEFQEFFVEDDKISQTASLLLDRIVRQGRAFGIHVLLGSQTLGGAYTVARTTLGQMVIRIALQCNEADAYLIMDENNPAPRLLSRPGEGIYNDMAGALEGNSPFQVVWLPEQVRDHYLAKVRARADRDAEKYPGPIVFEGNAPADVRENGVLRRLLHAPVLQRSVSGRFWLGAPNSIKGPTEAAFHRQSGNNLLMVGQRDEAVLAMLSVGLVSLAAQYSPGDVRLILCDATPPGTTPREYLERIASIIPHQITLAKPGVLPALMKELAAERKRRQEAVDPDAAPPVYLFIHGLQKFSRLRYEEDFSFSAGSDAEAEPNPGAVLNELICEGARLGFHLIATCDSYNNVTRFLSRKALSEFEMRVLFQMSANDSASLIDNPKAGMLGLHRALFYNAQEGYLETFRPYALPGTEWIEEAERELGRLIPGSDRRNASPSG